MAPSLDNLSALRQFFSSGTHLTFDKGEYIIRPEEEPSGVFFIEYGYVKAITTTKYSEENMLSMRKQGEIFPIIWTVTGDSRNIGYLAHTNTCLYRRSQKELEEAMKQSRELLYAMLVTSTIMYQSQSERISSLAYRTVRERIACFLITFARRFGTEHENGVLLDVPLTRHDIATSLSATRETVSREFSSLNRKGVIKQIDGHIIICDMAYLHSLL